METLVAQIKPEEVKLPLGMALFAKAGEILRNGGLVAFPTETVYGLGGDAFDPDAAGKIYAAKGRPSDNPLIVHIADVADLNEVAREIPDKAKMLMEAFWPGPLTLIFFKRQGIPCTVTGGLDTVAVRFPDNDIARAMIKSGGGFIAAPSANRSGSPSPTLAEHVLKDLQGRIDMVIDGGASVLGLESTIVDMTVDPPMILRPGFVTREMLEKVIGRVDVDAKILDANSPVPPKAPGMKYRHYAPKAELTVFEGEPIRAAKEMRRCADEAIANNEKVGIITTDELAVHFEGLNYRSIGSRIDPDTIAQNLYRVLREFDETDVEKIFSESFALDGVGQAIMNRLMKAAGQKVVHLANDNDLSKVDRIVFLDNSDSDRAPYAAYVLENMTLPRLISIESRGMVAPFPEPMCQGIQMILEKQGRRAIYHSARELSGEDIRKDTLFLTFDLKLKVKLLRKYEGIDNVYTLPEFLEEPALEIPSPYGHGEEGYEECCDIIENAVSRVAAKLSLIMLD